MPQFFKDKILKILTKRDYEPIKISQLAKALSVHPDEYQHFKIAFEELKKDKRVVITHGDLIALPPVTGRIIGTFRANPKGFGFITPLEPNAEGDLFIPPKAVSDAMTGDIVEAIVSLHVKPSIPAKLSGLSKEHKTALLEPLEKLLRAGSYSLMVHPI
jgi:ribonuclease R